jgi:hypothetical protein
MCWYNEKLKLSQARPFKKMTLDEQCDAETSQRKPGQQNAKADVQHLSAVTGKKR